MAAAPGIRRSEVSRYGCGQFHNRLPRGVRRYQVAERLSGAVLAAGRGERLREASGGIPKALIELNGEPLLLRQVRMLGRMGACPIHIIINSETEGLLRERRYKLPASVDLLVRNTPNSMESLLALGERIATRQFVLL